MRVRRADASLLFLCILSISLLLLSGCCGYIEDTKDGANATNSTIAAPQNQPPGVFLNLNSTEGPAPFGPPYSYQCYDPDGNLALCELKIDGQTFASGPNTSSLFPPNFTKPDFYFEAIREVGNHTLEIVATDRDGLTTSKSVEFHVLMGAELTAPGWFKCNDKPDHPPCDSMLAGYCDKFDETDLAVRQAASAAIAKHPGPFSINQMLDIYDYVRANVFYQNVPLDMWPPYYPNQTLATKSGDCKNQAVLIASMVEAIGGSAKILLIPDCHHAYPIVYAGLNKDVDALNKAIRAHYPQASGQVINWFYDKNKQNETVNWFIFDTAGGWFPGNTLPDCMNASQTFEIRDCSRDPDALIAPETEGTAFGPYTDLNESKVLPAGGGWNYWFQPDDIGKDGIRWCHYSLSLKSLSPSPFDWHLTDESGYQNAQALLGYSYYKGAEQVKEANYEFDWDSAKSFYVILNNRDRQNAMTVQAQLIKMCYQ